MKEALVKIEAPLVANEEATEVAQVSESALHFPASAIAAQRAFVLELHFAPAAMGADQLNSARGETLPEPLRIISAIANEPHRSVAGPPAPGGAPAQRSGFLPRGGLPRARR